MAWMDNTGLYQKYGTEQTETSTGGEYKTFAEAREIEVKIDLRDLTEAETIINDNIFFPKHMVIQEVEIYVDEAAATGVAIDMGLIETDRTTEIDYDAILKGVATATLTKGAKVLLVKGSSNVGDYITNGTVTSKVGHITMSRTTSTAFTTGILRIRIRYTRP